MQSNKIKYQIVKDALIYVNNETCIINEELEKLDGDEYDKKNEEYENKGWPYQDTWVAGFSDIKHIDGIVDIDYLNSLNYKTYQNIMFAVEYYKKQYMREDRPADVVETHKGLKDLYGIRSNMDRVDDKWKSNFHMKFFRGKIHHYSKRRSNYDEYKGYY
jgi:hypothetical protein